MPQPRQTPTFRVRFHPASFAEDLARCGRAGRQVGEAARKELERTGAQPSELAPCESEHRDGTDLGGLVKLYLPRPYGPWGLVLQGSRDRDGLHLLVVAFGERHPDRRPSVYDLAHHRLHGTWPAGVSS